MKDVEIEGCLTWPDKNVLSERFRRINVKYINENGHKVNREIRGFEAHIFQHEINHLDGKKEELIEPKKSIGVKIKIQRNENCPCNSGKKYKKCCGPYEVINTTVPRSDRLIGKIKEAYEKEMKEAIEAEKKEKEDKKPK